MHLRSIGIPTQKVNQFKRKEIETVEDLVRYIPKTYHDFRKPVSIKDLQPDTTVSVVAEIKQVKMHRNAFVQCKVADGTGFMYIGFFNQAYLMRKLKVGDTYIFCGKINVNPDFPFTQMTNPMYFSKNIEEYQRIIPVYKKIPNMSEDYLVRSIRKGLKTIGKRDPLEDSVRKKFGLITKIEALTEAHSPTSMEMVKKARKRLLFDDLFHFSLSLEMSNELGRKDSPFVMPKIKSVKPFLERLPFQLTEGQNQALRETYFKMRSGKRVNALIQGDVGCGKTIVAIILMFIVAENGYQSAMMAPTGVLAKQHYEELREKMEGTGHEVVYLSGDLKAKERRETLEKIKSGEAKMVVGTHAVISKDVKFKNLALTIVDEEHRFGVEQRNALREKARLGVHHVNMSATPIPRTLALAVYGDGIDVLTIKSLPKGRQPVVTVLRNNEERAYEGIYSEFKKGRQAYVVCPLIEESEHEGLEGIESVEETYEKMVNYFKKYPEVKIEMISGKMKNEEIEEVIERFTKNEVHVLVSTTIIEVGVNVPNATSIIIKNAERFGLAQLHQLRGRVGRGSHQSYCVLLTDKMDNPKLQAMVQTTDGFEIATYDLRLRGAGDFTGSKQTGRNKYVFLMFRFKKWFEQIQAEVKRIANDRERLAHYGYLVDLQDVSE